MLAPTLRDFTASLPPVGGERGDAGPDTPSALGSPVPGLGATVDVRVAARERFKRCHAVWRKRGRQKGGQEGRRDESAGVRRGREEGRHRDRRDGAWEGGGGKTQRRERGGRRGRDK